MFVLIEYFSIYSIVFMHFQEYVIDFYLYYIWLVSIGMWFLSFLRSQLYASSAWHIFLIKSNWSPLRSPRKSDGYDKIYDVGFDGSLIHNCVSNKNSNLSSKSKLRSFCHLLNELINWSFQFNCLNTSAFLPKRTSILLQFLIFLLKSIFPFLHWYKSPFWLFGSCTYKTAPDLSFFLIVINH